MHWASYVGYTDVVRKLHEHGADINCLDKDVSIKRYISLLLNKTSSKKFIRLLLKGLLV